MRREGGLPGVDLVILLISGNVARDWLAAFVASCTQFLTVSPDLDSHCIYSIYMLSGPVPREWVCDL